MLLVFFDYAVRHDAPGAGRRRRPRPAAALPDDDDPPADALLGLHAVHDPVRVRGRRAARRAASTPTGSASTRRFALAAWLFLGIGILLGARWSYAELGWGGYWGWDAVENASLMPWLTGTAFLHSVMIQEKRGMLKVWNASLVLGDRHARDHRHVPRALGRPQLDPRVRRVDARRAVRGADRGDGAPARSTSSSARRDVLRSRAPARLAALARGRLPAQQPRARRPLLRDLLGHLLPADLARRSPAPRRVGRPAVVRPLHRPARARARAAQRDRAGDRLAAGDARATRGATSRCRCRRGARWRSLALLASCRRRLGRPTVVAVLRRGLRDRRRSARSTGAAMRARRAMAARVAAVALLALVRRNRRRYGGYIVHVGIAVLFIGVAASSSFQHAQRRALRPGQSARVGAYTMRYVRSTGTSRRPPPHRATIDARRGAATSAAAATTSRRCTRGAASTPTQRRLAAGRRAPDQRRGVEPRRADAGLRRDLWTAVNSPARRCRSSRS